MVQTVAAVLVEAVEDLRRSWRVLAITDLAYKAIAFAVLTPSALLLLGWLRSRADARVLTDADILRFFVTTRIGVLALVLGAVLFLAISGLELACLMTVGLAAANRSPLTVRRALLFGARRAPEVLRLTAHVVVRLLAGALPFAVLGGLGAWTLLRSHDINYYLAARPPAFWVAAVATVALVGGLAALLVVAVTRWAFALPLVLFENVSPRRALAESAGRSVAQRGAIAGALATWAAAAGVLAVVANWLPETLGRLVAPHVAGTLPGLMLFIALLALLWAVLGLAAGVVNVSLLALVNLRLYLQRGTSSPPPLPSELTSDGHDAFLQLPRRVVLGAAAMVTLGFLGLGLLVGLVTSRSEPAVVIAHRGASAAAPENTLAAFRLAVEQGADLVELDVQESADGEVLVVHDSDLMKVAGVPSRIWEATAAELRAVDVGSFAGAGYAGERVPTLAEALSVCRGRSGVIVELKSYGHDQRLEERVAAIVEAAGMEQDCMYMSLDQEMVRRMKAIRPPWRSGLLIAKALGDATTLEADFLAVESRMATARFVRRAHRAGKEVYVWTVNDPAAMLSALSRGVDGLITDRPDLAREVVARRAEMSDAQRVLVALFVRLGVRSEGLLAEDALRP